MQQKASSLTASTGSTIRDSILAMKKTGTDSSLTSNDKLHNCNTLPPQSNKESNNNEKLNGGAKVKFSTLPSQNKLSARAAKVYETDIL